MTGIAEWAHVYGSFAFFVTQIYELNFIKSIHVELALLQPSDDTARLKEETTCLKNDEKPLSSTTFHYAPF